MSYTVSKIFIDTNLIVYTLDKSNVDKQERARNIIRKIVNVHQPVISTQVIKEFYVVAINKMKADPIIVKNILHRASCKNRIIKIKPASLEVSSNHIKSKTI